MPDQPYTPGNAQRKSFLARWLMSTNHKDIGILCLLTAGLVGVIAVLFSVYQRMELMEPGVQYMCLEGARFVASAATCTPNGHLWNVMITHHNSWVLHFALVPALLGVGSYALPLLIGAQDMAFPRINKLTFWLYVGGILISLTAILAPGVWTSANPDDGLGWVLYQPRSVTAAGEGAVDPAMLAFRIFLVASMLGALNLTVTFLTCRSPALTMGKVPPLGWLIVLLACAGLGWLPWLSRGIAMSLIDRNFGTTFFVPSDDDVLP